MSEVPSGLEMPSIERRPARPSATLMITRQGDDGEVLLGNRVINAIIPRLLGIPRRRCFQVDSAASEVLGISVQHCAILREVVEELGLAPLEGRMVSVEDDFHGS